MLAMNDPLEIKSLLEPRWAKEMEMLMVNEQDDKLMKEGETVKTSSVWSNKNGHETAKTIKTKKTVKDGKIC
jgi:hypothetical protein